MNVTYVGPTHTKLSDVRPGQLFCTTSCDDLMLMRESSRVTQIVPYVEDTTVGQFDRRGETPVFIVKGLEVKL